MAPPETQIFADWFVVAAGDEYDPEDNRDKSDKRENIATTKFIAVFDGAAASLNLSGCRLRSHRSGGETHSGNR